MKNLAKASLWLLLTGVMMFAAASCGDPKSENEVSIYSEGGWGYIDTTGQFVIGPQFGMCSDFSEGLARVGDASFIDKTGKCVIETPDSIDCADDFWEGFACVRSLDYEFGFIDKTGKIFVEPQFDETYSFSEGLARMKSDGLYGYIDTTGKMAIEPKFLFAGDFYEGLAEVCTDGLWGYIDKSGQFVIEPKYDFCDPFSEGLAGVNIHNEGDYGYIDKKGKMVIKPKFDNALSFDDGWACVLLEDKYGFIDKTGKMVIEPRFDGCGYYFNEGMCSVCIDNKWGFIDKTGKIVIEPQFAEADNFYDGLASVRIDDSYAFINKAGEIVIPWGAYEYKIYDFDIRDERSFLNMPWFSEGLCPVRVPEKYGLCDSEGNHITEALYDELEESANGLFIVGNNGQYGIIDRKGAVVADCVYSYVDIVKIVYKTKR